MANVALDCVIARPDIGELHDQLAAEFSKRLLNGGPVLPNSTEDVISFVMAGTVNLMHGMVSQALRENDPATMCCDNLMIYGASRGLNLRSAIRAKGYVALSGTPGAVIPRTLRLVGLSSREYKLDPQVTTNPTVLNAAGYASVRVVAALPGAVFNVRTGEMLTVTTTTAGIAMEATVLGNGIQGGGDDEDCETYRARLLAAESSDVMTTNEQWYLRETGSYPGVTRVCTDECEGNCDPTFVGLYPFMEGIYEPYGVPPPEVLDEMTLWMFGSQPGRGQGKAPIAIRGRYLAAVPSVIDVVAHCFQGCETDIDARIRAALVEYVRANFCVGSVICKDQLRAAVFRGLGANACIADTRFTFDNGVRYEDAANIYLDCGRLPVIGTVTLTTTAPP